MDRPTRLSVSPPPERLIGQEPDFRYTFGPMVEAGPPVAGAGLLAAPPVHQVIARWKPASRPMGSRTVPSIMLVAQDRRRVSMPRLEKGARLKLPHVPISKRSPQERITDFDEAAAGQK